MLMWFVTNRKLAIVGAILLAFGAVYLYGYYQGRQSVKQAAAIETIGVVKDVQKVREGVARLPDGDAGKRLQSEWSR